MAARDGWGFTPGLYLSRAELGGVRAGLPLGLSSLAGRRREIWIYIEYVETHTAAAGGRALRPAPRQCRRQAPPRGRGARRPQEGPDRRPGLEVRRPR